MAYGLLNVFKPSGPTSHDIVAAVRRGTGERRIGHAGTLDPMADGVLVLALGKATRLVEYLMASQKEYRAEITLGITTDTYDIQGTITSRQDEPPQLTLDDLTSVLSQFAGTILQTPPAYSAVKIGGKAAYARSRAGEQVQIAPREVTITELNVLAFDGSVLTLTVTCSAGTYIRSLAHDLGQTLGCGAALSKLRRVASGDFRVEDAAEWDELNASFRDSTWEKHLLPPERAVASLPRLTVDDVALRDISHGRAIGGEVTSGLCGAYTSDGRLVAILSAGKGDGLWYPHKVLFDAQDLDKSTTS